MRNWAERVGCFHHLEGEGEGERRIGWVFHHLEGEGQGERRIG